MINAMTRKPLSVSTGGTAGPYIMLPYHQLDDLRRLLDEHAIRFWVEENVISLNGGPEVATVNLGHGADGACDPVHPRWRRREVGYAMALADEIRALTGSRLLADLDCGP